MSNKMTALYARSAANNPEHITQQMNDLVTFAHANHFTNLCHFTDDGYSAFDKERPGFAALRNAILAKKVDTIIVKDVSRISRVYKDFCAFAVMAEENGVRLIAITEKVDILPKRIHDDDNGLDYELNGDYYLPVLLDPELEDHRPLGKWGMMRSDYLKEHRPAVKRAKRVRLEYKKSRPPRGSFEQWLNTHPYEKNIYDQEERIRREYKKELAMRHKEVH